MPFPTISHINNEQDRKFPGSQHLFSLSYFRSLPTGYPATRVLLLFLRLFLHKTTAVFFLFLSIFLFVYIWRFIIRNRHISPSPSTPSTLTTAQPQGIKYDVFLSFRGEDTRVGFTSHLHAALNRKQILTFIDDQLERGDEISASLLRTIEEAKLSVIVFSENYASSKWCLEELVKIFECRKNNGQIVIPVFYQVDPSHVRNQAGSFGDAFATLIKQKALTMDKEKSFTDALTDAANLSGWGLGNSGLESEFIEKIVGDVLEKLQAKSSSHTTGLFGIDDRVSAVESLLDMESPNVQIVGIWGMGGIGKTTIAEVVCNNVRSGFDRIFFANFRHQVDLQRSFLSQLLGQETLNTMSFRDPFVRDRLRRKKVLIVLDDVDNIMALEEWRDLLDGRNSSFGAGSKVLITSRDKQVLSNVVDETYEVKRLNYEVAIQLFSSKALKNSFPTIDQRDLIKQIVRHVQGNPLALKVLGASFYGKSIEKWRSASKKLAQDPQIERALRISYDGLDSEQKSIFLDIAHFFTGWEQHRATRILDGFYGRSVEFDISKLIDKCLITATHDDLEMHDLLQEMAFNIVRAESKFPGKRSRLCHLPDVVHVLEENKGTEEIEGISLDTSMLSRHIHLKSDAFTMMDGLRFLNFCHVGSSEEDKIHLPPAGLEYLPNKLRYLKWYGFPSKSLPPSFRAEHLVELHLRKSKLVKLWTGVKDVGNLRTIDLSESPFLTELPDLSMAKNLDVTTCPPISQNMTRLHLEQTSNKEVPQSVNCKLERLYLSGCSKITNFPENLKDIRILYLRGTAIKEVPSSIQFLTRLETLDMSGCLKLESFPEITVPMKSLQSLYLSKTGIKEIPLSIKDMVCLEVLTLHGTPIKELPLSIKDMVCLKDLTLHGTPIKGLPELPPSLRKLTTHNCASLETVTSIINIARLWDGLDFTNCLKLDQKPLVAAMHLKIQSGEEIPDGSIQMVLPGSEIPGWFGGEGIGSSVTIQLPSNCNRLKGIAFCLVFLLPLPSHDFDDRSYVHVYFDYHVKSKNGEHDGDDEAVLASEKTRALSFDLKTCDSDHMILRYELELVNHFRKYSGNEVTFKFYHHEVDNRRAFELKSWGVYLHFDENIPTDKKFKRKFWEI
nr:disease resistance protein RPV1-like [Populus alba]